MKRPVKCVSWYQWQQDSVEVGTIVILVNRPDLLFNFVNFSCLAACVSWPYVFLISLCAHCHDDERCWGNVS